VSVSPAAHAGVDEHGSPAGFWLPPLGPVPVDPGALPGAGAGVAPVPPVAGGALLSPGGVDVLLPGSTDPLHATATTARPTTKTIFVFIKLTMRAPRTQNACQRF